MAQFCSCGSIIINDHCTNKNCINKSNSGTTAKTLRASKKEPKEGGAAKGTKARRSSKCITYNLYDIKSPEEGI
ncbi:hypothetical protein DFR58_11865 [Anaerobacterium chartisolvens]|uniref:Uncharacterized protein n=1 Tax=Anaerobacterium chartisolvens TaxID=1297424 RepID=A0A369AYI4_9FIRM|nr:hypothetical protein [Anaerobacterium chartisolvens]RCX13247.1 hypothetical protein DFR58_11865 [Anaerobacterium chartisolvens]